MQRHIREAAPYARRAAPAKLIIVKMLINLAVESARSPSFSPLSPFSLMSSCVLFARRKEFLLVRTGPDNYPQISPPRLREFHFPNTAQEPRGLRRGHRDK